MPPTFEQVARAEAKPVPAAAAAAAAAVKMQVARRGSLHELAGPAAAKAAPMMEDIAASPLEAGLPESAARRPVARSVAAAQPHLPNWKWLVPSPGGVWDSVRQHPRKNTSWRSLWSGSGKLTPRCCLLQGQDERKVDAASIAC